MRSCIILGGGGHARVVIDCARLAGDFQIVGILDADPARHGAMVDGISILGGDEILSRLREEGCGSFLLGLGMGARERLYHVAIAAGLRPRSLIHPRAVVSAAATLGEGVQIFAGALVNAGATLGDNVLVNTGAIVEHDCTVAAHAHIASGACLAGGVRVGAGAHVGAAAVVRQGIVIGAGAMIGAGAAVVRDVASGTTVVGVPARVLSPR